MVRLLTFLVGLAVLFGSISADARDWPSAGGWDIADVDTDTCVMAMEYEGKGETALYLMLDTKGEVSMAVLNYGWSSVAGKPYDMVYYLNKTAFSGGKSVGTSSSGRHGFVTAFEPNFLTSFAASTYLTITTADDKIVDDLKLDGSAAGLTQLRRCVAHLKAVADAAAKERARFAHIPDDPFASSVTAPKDNGSAPKPRTSPNSIFNQDDYPMTARRNNEQGQVGYRLTVGPDGRVQACEITSSSGSASLDVSTCSILRTRLAFTPAKQSDGQPVVGTYDGTITWRL